MSFTLLLEVSEMSQCNACVVCKSSVKENNQFKLSIYKFVRDPKQGTKFSLIEYCKSTKSNVFVIAISFVHDFYADSITCYWMHIELHLGLYIIE